jgi:hypothetical protein
MPVIARILMDSNQRVRRHLVAHILEILGAAVGLGKQPVPQRVVAQLSIAIALILMEVKVHVPPQMDVHGTVYFCSVLVAISLVVMAVMTTVRVLVIMIMVFAQVTLITVLVLVVMILVLVLVHTITKFVQVHTTIHRQLL